MARGSKLFDQFADQIDFKNQVVSLGYEDPEELRMRKEREALAQAEKEKAAMEAWAAAAAPTLPTES